MKIFHLTHTDINTDSRILKQIKSLSFEKSFSIYGLGIKLNDSSVKDFLNRDNVKLESIDLYSKKISFLSRQFRHPFVFFELMINVLLKTRNSEIDIIHCHDTLVLPIGYLLKKIKKSKLIYDAHELESKKNGQTNFMSWGTLFIEKKCWKSVDLLISVSESILGWYEKNLGNKKKVLILNSPEISDSDKSINKPKLYKKKYFHNFYGIPHQTIIFLYLGFFTSGRGIEKIINAFNSDKISSHVVFVGFGDMKDIILLASKNNNKIHYHKAVKHDDVVDISRNADVGLCLIENISLSDYYCLPNKLFEYAFSGLPVLASDFPELNNVISKFELGFCCENKSSAIEKAIKKIENNPVAEINSNLSELSWEAQGKKLISAYRMI